MHFKTKLTRIGLLNQTLLNLTNVELATGSYTWLSKPTRHISDKSPVNVCKIVYYKSENYTYKRMVISHKLLKSTSPNFVRIFHILLIYILLNVWMSVTENNLSTIIVR